MDRYQIVTQLIARQAELGESDIHFAKRLGVARPTWTLLRQRRRGLGLTTLLRVFRAFPDLAKLSILSETRQ